MEKIGDLVGFRQDPYLRASALGSSHPHQDGEPGR